MPSVSARTTGDKTRFRISVMFHRGTFSLWCQSSSGYVNKSSSGFWRYCGCRQVEPDATQCRSRCVSASSMCARNAESDQRRPHDVTGGQPVQRFSRHAAKCHSVAASKSKHTVRAQHYRGSARRTLKAVMVAAARHPVEQAQTTTPIGR